MSACAINCISDSEILIHSDGLKTHFQTGKVLDKKCSKIFRLNDRCAIVHFGSFIEFMTKFVENIRGTWHAEQDPGITAHGLGEALKAFIGVRAEDLSRDYLALIVGFNDLGSSELWQLANFSDRGREYGFEGKNPFDPIKLDFKPGDSLAIATGIPRNKSDFNQRLKSYRDQQLHEKAAAYWAFVDFVEALEKKGVLVGGQIFSEALTPPGGLEKISLTDMQAFMDT